MGGIEFLNMSVVWTGRLALRCVCDCDSGLLFSVKGQHRRILLAARVVVSLEAGASTHVWVSLFQALSRARAYCCCSAINDTDGGCSPNQV